MTPVSLSDEVRAACAWVAERARSVRIDEEAIEEYAATLPQPGPADGPAPFAEDPETAAAFAICMNAINFGSGWWPTIRKRPGHSGYATMAAGVTDRFAAVGPWGAEELRAMDADGTHGSGPEAAGPLVALVMAMTGRTAALDDLTGEGVAPLRGRS